MKTLQQFLAENKKGTFSIIARRIGRPHSRRRIDVPAHNHQDIWVWIADRKGNATNVEARIDRRTGRDDFNNLAAADYEVLG